MQLSNLLRKEHKDNSLIYYKDYVNNPELFETIKGKTAIMADAPGLCELYYERGLKPSKIDRIQRKGFVAENDSIPWEYAKLVS